MKHLNPLRTCQIKGEARCFPKFFFIFSLLFFAALISAKAQTIIYVNHAATGANNGSSWVNAFTELQDAIDAAGAGNQVWVAKGVYIPTATQGGVILYNKTFFINKNIELYGGFSGSESSLIQRDYLNNTTILSGDLENDDVNFDGDFIANATTDLVGANSYHVVWIDSVSSAMRIDGFTVTAGSATGSGPQGITRIGGGILNDGSGAGNQSSPTIANIVFSGNIAGSGGGLCNNAEDGGNTSPVVSNCVFNGNSASFGGAVHNTARDGGNAHPDFSNCSFSANYAELGGAFSNYCENNGVVSPVIANCRFSNNSTNSAGGAMLNSANGGTLSPQISNCLFFGNTSNDAGGAMANLTGGANPALINCTFYGNTAVNHGGAVYNISASLGNITNPSFTNCILWANTANTGNSIANLFDATSQISYSLLNETNCPPGVTCGSGMIYNQNPLFADAGNGNLRLLTGSPAIDAGDNSVISSGNTADLDGNARIFNATGLPVATVDLGPYEFEAPPLFAPTANFSSNQTEGCAPLTVSFADLSTGNPASWSWQFPGGTPSGSNQQNPTVVYSTAGIYAVTLTASNATGSSTIVQTNFITVNPGPTAGFTSTTDSTTVSFTNTSTNADTYLWNFGDNNTSVEANPTYTYTTPGIYQVALTATNSCGSAVANQTVTILSSADEPAWAKTLRVFPNPNVGAFNIEINEAPSGEAVFTLFNPIGEAVHQEKFDIQQGGLNRSFNYEHLAPAVYTLQIRIKSEAIFVKIVVLK